MLKMQTKEMINKLDELMDKFKTRVTLKDLEYMNPEDLELMKESMKLYEMSCEIAVKQAEVIDRLDKTTQELLAINKTLLERTKGL